MKLPLKIGLIVIVPMIAMMMILFYNLNNKLVTVVKKSAWEKEYKELEKFNSEIDMIFKELKNIVSLISVSSKDEIDDIYQIKIKFEKIFKSMQVVNSLRAISLNGFEIIGFNKQEFFKYTSGKYYFNDEIFQVPLVEDRYFISDPYFLDITGELCVDISKRIIDMNTGKVLGVVTGNFSLSRIYQLINDKLLKRYGVALYNNNTKSFIYKSSSIEDVPNEAFFKKPFGVYNLEIDGQEHTLLHSEYKNMDMELSFYILIKEVELSEEVNKIVHENFYILILIIMISLLILLLMVGYMLKPLNLLTDRIKLKIKKLDYHYKDKETRGDEVIKLNKYFNILDDTIKKDREKLEKFNIKLQQEIEKEVQKSREKDTLLFQQSKMASMGEMLSNIAHQWRQPLSVISTVSSGIKLSQDFGTFDEKEMRKDLDLIIKNTSYLSSTIDDFRQFFKNNDKVLPFEVSEIMDNINSLQSKSMENIGVEFIYEYEEIEILGYKNELIQVILNILNNAKDQLVKQDREKRKLIFLNILKQNGDILIEIKDSGGGIPEDIMDKLFEPYFTTKHQSQGTGIGLYMSQEIITKHFNGSITAQNVEFDFENVNYKGAMFTIKFPHN